MPDMERHQYINRLLRQCEVMKHRMDRVRFNGSVCFACGKAITISETDTTISHTGDLDKTPCTIRKQNHGEEKRNTPPTLRTT